MNIDSKNKSAKRKHKKPLLASLALMCSLAVGGANAQWIVNDPAHMMQNILTQLEQMGKDVAEYAEQAARWQQQYSHYRQQLIKAQSMFTKLGLPQSVTLEKVEDDYMIADRCRGAGGGLLSGLKNMLTLDPNGDLMKQQQQICVNIQVMENRKYNETVEFLKKSMPELDQTLATLKSMRDSNNDQGNLTKVSYDAEALTADMNKSFAEWESRMNSYDAYIQSMQQAQKTLTQIALKGKQSSPLGTLVKTTALQGALEVGN
ncbi:hypothetical protein [Pseudoxanthomonas sacheonensis]|uniref:hypothetical protein n=1 Tax=Pseudoxanthomonas sacheonensis TaxID=443615 RepID=UPI0013D56F70|nr:hypothetical protein [Pseudoxanthomonas sacheonensis]KAF1707045.1 hypothetical protein CSC73_13510 [Pseudoxanthomonas sacheonensis]